MGWAGVELWTGIPAAFACAVVALVVGLRRIGSPAGALGAGVASALFAGHAAVVASVAVRSGPATADLPVLNWLVTHRSGGTTRLMTLVSALGGTAGMAVLAVVAAALLWWRRHRPEAVVALVAASGAGLLVVAFKNVYGRMRPPVPVQLVPQTSLSLPSGHALGSIVVLGVLAVLATRLCAARTLRAGVPILAGTAVALIGVSRLYLGVHWLTDVLAGWLLGGAWAVLCLTVLIVTSAHGRIVARARRSPSPGDADGPDLVPVHIAEERQR